MEKFEIGMLAKSKAGHDKGTVYVILSSDEEYVYLADGRLKTTGSTKKKKKKHVQLICRKYDVSDADDVAIKRILKEYKEKEGKKEEA